MNNQNLKILLIFLFGLFSGISSFAQNDSISAESYVEEVDCEEYIFYNPEMAPVYEGGELALRKFIEENLIYPQGEQIEAKVYVGFTVSKTGEVKNVIIRRGVNPRYDKAALDVVRKLPNFSKPGTMCGKVVETRYTVPVKFQIKQ